MFLSFRESWVKRKRQCSEVIGHRESISHFSSHHIKLSDTPLAYPHGYQLLSTVADSMDKKPKATEEMIGIETDGDVGVQVPALPAATRKKTPVIRKLKKK